MLDDRPKLVALHDGRPALTDVVGRLRTLADQIETGIIEDARTVIVLIPQPGKYPRVFGFGDVGGVHDPAFICEMAKLSLVLNLVERS